GARRGDPQRDRRVRSREGLHRHPHEPYRGALSDPEGGLRAHHHRRCRAVRARGTGHRGRHHHRAPPAVQPQPHAGGRHSPALLLPADPQAQHPPGSPAGCRHQRQSEVLPGHRLGAPRPSHQGSRLRLRRLLHRLRRHRAVRRGVRIAQRTGQAGGLRQPVRSRFLRPAAQHRPHHPGARGLAGARRTAVRPTPPDASARRRNPALAGTGGTRVSEELYEDDELETRSSSPKHPMARRFRGYLPVVVDVETGGFNCQTDALLEIAATIIGMDEQGLLYSEHTYFHRVEPFEGANIEQAALEFTGIKLDHPLRMAVTEDVALTEIFRGVRKSLKAYDCKRAVLVGHNSSFDLGFLNAAVLRTGIKRNPFHPFSSFDTATLAGLAYGQTVLAKACQAAGIAFDAREAHSARYDTEKTAELFCGIVNRWKEMGGWDTFGED